MDSWADLFFEKTDKYNNIELPRVTGWLPKNPHSDGIQMQWERNPYYWKVDTEGSQLPYIDNLFYRIFTDEESIILAAAHGDVDMYAREPLTLPRNKPVLARSQETGGYHLPDMRATSMNTAGIAFNLTHPDPVKREVLQNKDFRIGLSHATDRQQIIDIVHQRQGEPWQTAPRPEVPFYDSDDIGKQYTGYDLDLANDYLDKAGYTKRDPGGIRLGPDGRPIMIEPHDPDSLL